MPLNESSAPDYRRSHLKRGQHYDANLDQDPASAYLTAWERELLPRVVSRYFPAGIDRYLDFACGTGRVTQLLAPFARQVVGVDVSESMMNVAIARLPDATFVNADITRAVDDQAHDLGSFNLISSFRFFGNAEDSLRAAVLRALHGLLADDGILLINNHRNPNAVAMRLQRATGGVVDMDLTHSKLVSLLKDTGFVVDWCRPIGAWQLRASWVARARADVAIHRFLERTCTATWLAPIAPTTLLVARKRNRNG